MSIEVDIEEIDNHSQKQENIIHVSGMYENWFLDYASYVILERSVPYITRWIKTSLEKDFIFIKTIR